MSKTFMTPGVLSPAAPARAHITQEQSGAPAHQH